MALTMELAYAIDLSAPLVTQHLPTLLIEGDQKAHTLVLTVTDSAHAASLSGVSAFARFRRPGDGVVVLCPGTISGNVVRIPLPANCYAYPGDCAAIVRLGKTAENTHRTVLRLVGVLEGEGSGTVIDPSGSIPTVADIAQAFEELESGIAEAAAATTAASGAAMRATSAAGTATSAAESATAAADAATAAAGAASAAAGSATTAAGAATNAAGTATSAAEDATAATEAAESATEDATAAADYANGLRAPTTYSGTAITGMTTTPTAYETGIADARIGERYYYNGTQMMEIGNVYRCTQGGDEDAALWVFDGNIRGTPGAGNVSFVDGVQPDANGDVPLSAVRHTVQNLTVAQMQQARANLGAAAAVHTHAQSDISGLAGALDGKAAATDLTAHVGATDNPHGVSLSQLGCFRLLWNGTLSVGGEAVLDPAFSQYSLFAFTFSSRIVFGQFRGAYPKAESINALARASTNENMQTIIATLSLASNGVLSFSGGYTLTHTSGAAHGVQTSSTTRTITNVYGLC